MKETTSRESSDDSLQWAFLRVLRLCSLVEQHCRDARDKLEMTVKTAPAGTDAAPMANVHALAQANLFERRIGGLAPFVRGNYIATVLISGDSDSCEITMNAVVSRH
jgi:hypothetical protein